MITLVADGILFGLFLSMLLYFSGYSLRVIELFMKWK